MFVNVVHLHLLQIFGYIPEYNFVLKVLFNIGNCLFLLIKFYFSVRIYPFSVANILGCIFITPYPTNIYLFKVNNKNIRKRCEIRSKLIIKTPERDVNDVVLVFFIANFENIPHLFLCYYC